jgi:hypothetical protein
VSVQRTRRRGTMRAMRWLRIVLVSLVLCAIELAPAGSSARRALLPSYRVRVVRARCGRAPEPASLTVTPQGARRARLDFRGIDGPASIPLQLGASGSHGAPPSVYIFAAEPDLPDPRRCVYRGRAIVSGLPAGPTHFSMRVDPQGTMAEADAAIR